MSEDFVNPEEYKSFCELMEGEEPSDAEEACGSPLAKHGLALSSPPSPNVERIDTTAPMPFLRKGAPVYAFRALKQSCIDKAGFDFLAICGDVMRDKNFQSNKPGVASKSRHKCGQAFDYNQADKRLIIVADPHGGNQYFRTWLKCAKQDGTQGSKVVLKDIRGFKTNVYAWDFTAAAEAVGWSRIPAWSGWQSSYNKKEFWHYQLTQGTSYEDAMDYLYKFVPAPTVDLTILQLGSQGEEVKQYQHKLYVLKFLPSVSDVDGKFGPRTRLAVIAFQRAYGLSPDGKLGPFSKRKINQLIEEKNKMGLDYNVDEVNAAVVADDEMEPKPWYRTSAFYTLLTTYVVSGVVALLVGKGIVDAGQAGALTDILAGAVIAGLAYVSGKFIEGRTAVSVVKAKAAAVRSLAASSPEALSAFRALDR